MDTSKSEVEGMANVGADVNRVDHGALFHAIGDFLY